MLDLAVQGFGNIVKNTAAVLNIVESESVPDAR